MYTAFHGASVAENSATQWPKITKVVENHCEC